MSRRPRWLPAACLVLVAGCGLIRIRPGPPRELWRLTPSDSVFGRLTNGARPLVAPVDTMAVRSTSSGDGGGAVRTPALTGTLAIVGYTTPGIYGERGVVFRRGEAEYNAYPNREWAIPLGDMLAAMTAEIAAHGALTAADPVFDAPSASAQTYLWRATVRRFEEVDRGTEVSVSVRIEARLVRSADDSVVWAGTAAMDRPVARPTTSMSNVVIALSDASAQVIAQLLANAERDLRRDAAAPAPARP